MIVVHLADADNSSEYMRVEGFRWDKDVYCCRLRDGALFLVPPKELKVVEGVYS